MTELAVHQESDDEERRRLGDRLREARKYLGLKQEEVATYLKSLAPRSPTSRTVSVASKRSS